MDRSRSTEAGRLAVEHLDLAQHIARRWFRGDPARDEDLVQVAFVGLVKAAQRFDVGRGIPFVGFAAPTITGEIKRHLRDHGWFVRPPRELQDLARRVAEASPRLAQSLGRHPSEQEVAAELDESVDAVREADGCRTHLRPASLDAQVGDSQGTLGDLVADLRSPFGDADRGLLLAWAVSSLDERDRLIVRLRFDEELSQERIAEQLGVSQMQVSRLLRRILAALRERVDPVPVVPAVGEGLALTA